MGWWSTNKTGASFTETGEGEPEMLWGDTPADFMDDALNYISDEFKKTFDRLPTCGELRAGLEFSLMQAPDDTPFDRDQIFNSGISR